MLKRSAALITSGLSDCLAGRCHRPAIAGMRAVVDREAQHRVALLVQGRALQRVAAIRAAGSAGPSSIWYRQASSVSVSASAFDWQENVTSSRSIARIPPSLCRFRRHRRTIAPYS